MGNALRSRCARLLQSGLDWLSPVECLGCGGEPLRQPDSLPVCARCAGELHPGPWIRNLGDGLVAIAPFTYRGPASRAVRRLKYAGRTDYASPLGAALMRALRLSGAPAPRALVPVPAHFTRLAERGFNPAALLARAAAAHATASYAPRALRRIRATPPQAGLSRSRRLDNVAGAFTAHHPPTCRTWTLVDDVVTTGSTARDCARAARRAGAHIEVVACVALAPLDQDHGDENR